MMTNTFPGRRPGAETMTGRACKPFVVRRESRPKVEVAIEPWFEMDRLELRSRPILLTTNGVGWIPCHSVEQSDPQ